MRAIAAMAVRSACPYVCRDNELAQNVMTDTPATAVIPGFVEKAPLERYVDPDRPSLIGKSRAELAAMLGELGVPPTQRKMRVQ